jgi:hypothetical protein
LRYRTVNLLPRTFERLLVYKVAGRSFDDVILALMDRVRVEEYHRDVVREVSSKAREKGRTVFERELVRGWSRMLRERRRRAGRPSRS